jgi:hypothetical protein
MSGTNPVTPVPAIPVPAIPDPVTRLTLAELAFVAWLDLTSNKADVLAALQANLQTAVEIELATIPIYLFTYYSIVRNQQLGESIGPEQLFANKAGAVIMSVAVEEMLHMSLSANVLYSLGGAPQIYGNAPASYPTGLPYHDPKGPPGPNGATAVSIPLSRLTFEQLWHFLQIEYPEARGALPQDRNWDTIGQFYSYLRCLISTKFLTDADFRQGNVSYQIQSYNYSPNNVDTVYPSGQFDPWKPAPPAPTPSWTPPDPYPTASAAAVYTDTADSHAGKVELLTVRTKRDALEAIDTVCDQGEGYPVPWKGESPYDDPSKQENSHYYKFLSLQAQFDEYMHNEEVLPTVPKPPAPITPTVSEASLGDLIINFPDNPVTASYPPAYQPISTFCNGLFQYMLIMTETVFRVPPQSQKLFFNEGLHRSMIWVMDKYIRTIREIPLPNSGGPVQYMAPTFEFVDLGPRKQSFTGLTRLGDAAMDAASTVMVQNPNTPLADTMGDVIWYVQVALTKVDGAGVPMHLPDVAQYW